MEAETGKQLVIEITTKSLISLLLSTLSTPDRVVHLRVNRLSPSGAPAPNSVGLSFTRAVFCSHLKECIFHDTAEKRHSRLATAFDQTASSKSRRSTVLSTRITLCWPVKQSYFHLIISRNFGLILSIPFVMMPKHTSSILSETSMFFTGDEERVSKTESSRKSSTPLLHVLLQTHSRVRSSTPAALFKQEESDFQSTSRNAKMSPQTDFHPFHVLAQLVSGRLRRSNCTPSLNSFQEFLSPTRHCKRIGHNAVVLMRLCKISWITPRGIPPTRYSFRAKRHEIDSVHLLCTCLFKSFWSIAWTRDVSDGSHHPTRSR